MNSKVVAQVVGVEDVQGRAEHPPHSHQPRRHQGHHAIRCGSRIAPAVSSTPIATFNMYVNLPHDFKGTHMSRFVSILNQHEREISVESFRTCWRR